MPTRRERRQFLAVFAFMLFVFVGATCWLWVSVIRAWLRLHPTW
jgi:hypothetical protein